MALRAKFLRQHRPVLAFFKPWATFASVCLEDGDALPPTLPKESGRDGDALPKLPPKVTRTRTPSIGLLIDSSLDPNSGGSVTRVFLEKHMGIGEDKMEERMASLSQLLRFYSEHGMTKEKLQKLFRDEPRLFTLDNSNDKLDRLLSVFREAKVEKELVGKIIQRSPKIVELEPEKLRATVSYLISLLGKDSKVLGTLLVNRPSLQTLQIEEDLIPKVNFLRSLQVSPSRISKLFQMWPAFTSISLERELKPRLELLVKHGIRGKNLEQVLVKYPWVVLDSKTDLEKAVAYFQSWNFQGRGLTKVLSWRPQAITGDYHVFATLERFLVETGFEKGTPTFESAFCMVITLNPDCLRAKLDRFLKYGISKDEVTLMFRKQASIATISDNFLEAKMRFLLDTVNMKREDIVKAPVSLTYSLEKRMRPRLELMKWLLAQGYVKRMKSWVSVMSVSDLKFLRSTCRGHPEAAAKYKALCMRGSKSPLES